MTELDPSLRALVDAYRQAQTPAPVAVDVAWRSVAARVDAGAAPTLDATPRTAIGVKLAIVGVAVIAVTAAVIGATAQPHRGPTPTEPAMATQEIAAPPPPTPAPTPPTVEPAGLPDARPLDVEPPRETVPRPRRPRAAATEPASLAAELELLRAMRAALRGGEAPRALELAARHRQRYPASAFAEERSATEVMALCVQGRTAEAKTKAAGFRRRYPSSSFDVDRCDDPTTGTK